MGLGRQERRLVVWELGKGVREEGGGKGGAGQV